MGNFPLSTMALKCLAPSNEILYDDIGQPSVMVRIPKMTYADLGMGESTDVFPAFIVDGQEVDAIWISKYLNTIINGRAYSLPGTFETAAGLSTARNACLKKGAGWHLMTRLEWGLMVRICEHIGTLPKGNTDYGKGQNESDYKAIPIDYTFYRTFLTATGSGPLTWFHDGTPGGVADLAGNVQEWSDGIQFDARELRLLTNYDAIVGNANWKVLDATTGQLVDPIGYPYTEGAVKLNNTLVPGGGVAPQFQTLDPDPSVLSVVKGWGLATCGNEIGAEAKKLLQAMALVPFSSSDKCAATIKDGEILVETTKSRLLSGTYYHDTSACFAAYRTADLSSGHGVGFRAAYVELPTEE